MAKSTRYFDVTITPDELASYEASVFEELREALELPGFRRGHVPKDIASAHIDDERVFREAVERAIAEKCAATLNAHPEEFVGDPRVEVRKVGRGNPLEFRISVDVLPEIPIDDWRELRIAARTPSVDDADIERTLEEIRRSRVLERSVRRPAALGDRVEVDFTVRVDGVIVEGGSAKGYSLILGEHEEILLPGFAEAIVGMSSNEEKTVRLRFPEDWRNRTFAGKEGEFTIVLRNVIERTLPALDDAFAQSLGRFANLEDLRSSIREGLLAERREAESRRIRVEAVERLAERLADEDIPPVLVDAEVARMVDEFRAAIEEHGATFEDYLAQIGKRREDIAEGFRAGALRRVKGAMVLRAIAKREGIAPEPGEVEERMEETLRRFRSPQQASAAHVDPEKLRSYTENVLRNEKTLALIEEVVTSNAQQNHAPEER